MITFIEVAELIIQMNDGSRSIAEQVKALEAENAALKAQLAGKQPEDGLRSK